MKRIGRLIEDNPGHFRVWAEDEKRVGTEHLYIGPVAHVYGDADWVHVVTDQYEGAAMVNREALLCLIEALTRLESHLANK